MKNWFWGFVIFICGTYVAGSTSKPQTNINTNPVYTSSVLGVSSAKFVQVSSSFSSTVSSFQNQNNQLYSSDSELTGNYIPYKGNGGGPTRCADGTISNSSGKGTCSHHGGIAR